MNRLSVLALSATLLFSTTGCSIFQGFWNWSKNTGESLGNSLGARSSCKKMFCFGDDDGAQPASGPQTAYPGAAPGGYGADPYGQNAPAAYGNATANSYAAPSTSGSVSTSRPWGNNTASAPTTSYSAPSYGTPSYAAPAVNTPAPAAYAAPTNGQPYIAPNEPVIMPNPAAGDAFVEPGGILEGAPVNAQGIVPYDYDPQAGSYANPNAQPWEEGGPKPYEVEGLPNSPLDQLKQQYDCRT